MPLNKKEAEKAILVRDEKQMRQVLDQSWEKYDQLGDVTVRGQEFTVQDAIRRYFLARFVTEFFKKKWGDEKQIGPDAKDSGEPKLYSLIRYHSADEVKQFLSSSTEKKKQLTTLFSNKQSPLEYAITRFQYDTAKIILEELTQLGLAEQEVLKSHAIYHLGRHGDPETLKTFLDALSPEKQRSEILKDYGSDYETTNWNLFQVAARYNDYEGVISLLLERVGDDHQYFLVKRKDGWDPLNVATEGRNIVAVREILSCLTPDEVTQAIQNSLKAPWNELYISAWLRDEELFEIFQPYFMKLYSPEEYQRVEKICNFLREQYDDRLNQPALPGGWIPMTLILHKGTNELIMDFLKTPEKKVIPSNAQNLILSLGIDNIPSDMGKCLYAYHALYAYFYRVTVVDQSHYERYRNFLGFLKQLDKRSPTFYSGDFDALVRPFRRGGTKLQQRYLDALLLVKKYYEQLKTEEQREAVINYFKDVESVYAPPTSINEGFMRVVRDGDDQELKRFLMVPSYPMVNESRALQQHCRQFEPKTPLAKAVVAFQYLYNYFDWKGVEAKRYIQRYENFKSFIDNLSADRKSFSDNFHILTVPFKKSVKDGRLSQEYLNSLIGLKQSYEQISKEEDRAFVIKYIKGFLAQNPLSKEAAKERQERPSQVPATIFAERGQEMTGMGKGSKSDAPSPIDDMRL